MPADAIRCDAALCLTSLDLVRLLLESTLLACLFASLLACLFACLLARLLLLLPVNETSHLRLASIASASVHPTTFFLRLPLPCVSAFASSPLLQLRFLDRRRFSPTEPGSSGDGVSGLLPLFNAPWLPHYRSTLTLSSPTVRPTSHSFTHLDLLLAPRLSLCFPRPHTS